MNLKNIKRVKDEYLKKGRKPLNERLGILLYKSVCRKKIKAKFITIVREPVNRNFSAFFQNFKRFTGSEFKESKLYTEELIRIFISEYMHDVPLTWFDIEIKNTLGMDVYNFHFPKEKGHMVIQKDNSEIDAIWSKWSDNNKPRSNV